MDESRKRVLLIAAAILASRKLSSESVAPGQSPRAAMEKATPPRKLAQLAMAAQKKFPL